MIRLKEILDQPESGKPLTKLVYRGDDKKFKEFDYSFVGKSTGENTGGFWFSSSRDAAMFYGKYVRKFKIHMENPCVISSEEFSKNYPHGPVYFAKKAAVEGYDGVVILDIMDGDRYSNVYCMFDSENIQPV